jgi:predicted CoA-substrate-specific enzyme activase
MRYAGIDIGSRSIELVVIEDGKIKLTKQADTGFDPLSAARDIIREVNYDLITATGYGRNLFEISFEGDTVTEIKAHAKGARFIFPEAVTVLDIGGQDSKAIQMNGNGKVVKFEMNDRCAAGTGKFLEIMAVSLGFNIENFGAFALGAKDALKINSMCTVFAESEVTSLVAKGHKRNEIAKGLHLSVVKRAVSMLKKISDKGDIIFSGGVANNRCMVQFLEDVTNRKIYVPENPQMTGAIGAALITEEKMR